MIHFLHCGDGTIFRNFQPACYGGVFRRSRVRLVRPVRQKFTPSKIQNVKMPGWFSKKTTANRLKIVGSAVGDILRMHDTDCFLYLCSRRFLTGKNHACGFEAAAFFFGLCFRFGLTTMDFSAIRRARSLFFMSRRAVILRFCSSRGTVLPDSQ